MLTIPNLIAHYQKMIVVTRMQKFYSSFNQAIKMSEIKNGSVEDWIFPFGGYGNAEMQIEFYEKYLKDYLKVVKYEKYYDNNISLYGIKMYFGDGSAALYGDQHIVFYPVATKNSIDGKDSFTFVFTPNTKSMVPYGIHTKQTRNDLKNHPTFGCGRIENKNRRYCAALIMHDGWKISDDYPVKF